MNVIFMGTPDFSVPTLEKIYQAGHKISLVITQTDKPKGRGKKVTFQPVKVKAQELGLEVYQPKNVNSEESIIRLREINPDVIVVIAYGQILKKEILNLPKHGCINVHASLLPKYRGSAPINWVIINGEEKTGITTIYMEKGIDTGDMLLKKEIKIKENETSGELHDRLMILGAEVLIDTLTEIERGSINRIPQDDNKSSYVPVMNKDLGKIDWNKNSKDIFNLVRGTDPWPSSYVTYQDKKVKISNVEVVKRFKDGQPGEVVKVDGSGIYVNTKDSCLVIKKLQFPGKKMMTVSDFLKGNHFKVGEVL